MFRRLGAEVIQADQIGHEVLVEPETMEQLRQRWGERVFGPDGQVSRSRVASIVFAPGPEGARERQFLESVTHPRIAQRIRERIEQLAQQGTRVTVLDAAILLEGGWRRHCDRLVFVEVDRTERLRRARQRGWSESQFAAREASQLPIEEKRKVADVVIDNSASIDHTLAQIQQFWHSLDPLLPE
jgi:dephospho-CoA kinase